MFNFLKRFSNSAEPDLSFLAVDMHSHLLPGIDDGVQDIKQSIQFVAELQKLGYQKLFFTPHIISDLYPNSRDTILPKLDMVRSALRDANINMAVDAAAEYMIDHEFIDLLETSKKDHFLTINGEHILVEMSYLSPSPNFEKVIFDLRMLGLQPILAHPERYNYLHNQFGQYERFKELGCKLQVNLLSLSGVYGNQVKKTAKKLFKNKLVDFLGTDMHHSRHLATLRSLASKKEFYELIGDAEFLNKTLL